MYNISVKAIKQAAKELKVDSQNFRVIHIGGTNGKGRVVNFLESIAVENGCIVGAYTSPHMYTVLENIRICKKQVEKKEFERLYRQIEGYNAQCKKEDRLTEFEKETLIALLYFKENNCDTVFIEVGLGGKEDATNIVKKEKVVLLAQISIDHKEELGETLKEIALGECEIIEKSNVVISAPQKGVVKRVIINKCKENGCKLIFSKNAKSKDELNKGLAIKTAQALGYKDTDIENGIRKAKWHGRFSVIRKNPTIILDAAHNASSITGLVKRIKKEYKNKEIVFITNFLYSKEIDKMLKIIKRVACGIVIFVDEKNNKLAPLHMLNKYIPSALVEYMPLNALKAAVSLCVGDCVIVICGSISILAQLEEAAKKL